ncbi:MAG: hypothetical protein P4L85_16160 [Paludisphaera borealis]|uniref:hypothetical protein n=1 Tax=Paludisphaera borealis TaxID=1387353 RepID=UPI00284383BA|nr:hypothetical protein [Paludisphaera borealis]MDR3620887.1 hypothetical protein [Paludisphaera borealis]
MKTIASFHGSEQRYGSLRVIASICTFLGGLLLVLGPLLLAITLYVAVSAASPPPPIGPRGFGPPQASSAPFITGVGATLSLLWSFGSLLGGLQLLAAGALIRLMIQLEENTRATAQLLDRVRSRLDPHEEGTGSIFIA